MTRSANGRVLVALVALTACPAFAQKAESRQSEDVSSSGLLIVISDSGKIAYGYSFLTGELATIAIDKDKNEKITPIVSHGIGVFTSGRKVYAFSGGSAKWGGVDVGPAGVPQKDLIVSPAVTWFVAGGKVYAFGDKSEKWAVADVGSGVSPQVWSNSVRINVGRRIYLFSSESSNWSIIDLAKDG